MPVIRISDTDHAELLKRKEETGVSITFQLSKLIKDSRECDNDQEKTPIPSTISN